MKLFIHRAGRTARAGQKGVAYTIITPDELPYLVETSLFVGRKYFNKDETDYDIVDPSKISFGTVPQKILDEYSIIVKELHRTHETLNVWEKSCLNAMKKYRKTKDPASKQSLHRAKEIEDISYHPLFKNKVSQKEIELDDFMKNIRQFKPKSNFLEINKKSTATNKREFETFKKILKKQDYYINMHKREVENKKEIKNLVGDKPTNEEQTQDPDSEMEEEEVKVKPKETSSINKVKEEENIVKLTKRSVNKRDSSTDYSLNLENPVKRSKRTDFRDPNFFITNAPSSNKNTNPWGEDDPNAINEVTLNILPDDEREFMKKQSHTKWDPRKKKYVQTVMDSRGNKVKTNKNESGKSIDEKKGKDKLIYQKWMRKSHMRVQKTGEMEDQGNTGSAKNAHGDRHKPRDRNESKDRKQGRGVKNELKSTDEILKKKKKDFKKSGGGKGMIKAKEKYQKSLDKIMRRAGGPTRSKVITGGKKTKKMGRR